MKLLAFLMFVNAALSVMAFEMTSYKNHFQSQVAIPYKEGITVIATDIIEYLAITPVPNTTAAGQRVASHITSKAEEFSIHLEMASNASDWLRLNLDHEVTKLVVLGSQVEQKLKANTEELAETNRRIQQTTAQLADAQHRVNQAVESVQHAERRVREEEERVEKARLCRGKRGWDIGKFFSEIGKPFEDAVKNVIVRPVCRVINHQGIQNAKHARGMSQNNLSNQRTRLADVQTKLAQLNGERNSLNQARARFEATKTNLNVQLTNTNQARNNVNGINVGLKSMMAHIVSLRGKSKVLKDVVTSLIDMETVINPLSAVADQVLEYTTSVSDINHMNAMKQKIRASLPLVTQKLPQYGFVLSD